MKPDFLQKIQDFTKLVQANLSQAVGKWGSGLQSSEPLSNRASEAGTGAPAAVTGGVEWGAEVWREQALSKRHWSVSG